MRRLVVNDYGVFLGKKGDRIIVKKHGEKTIEVPAGNISQILLASKGVAVSSAVLRLALKYNVDLAVVSGYGKPLGRFISWRGSTVQLKRNQYDAQTDWRGCFLAKQFARAKILNQLNLLKSLAKNRKLTKPDLAKELFALSEQISSICRKMDTLPQTSLDKLRGDIRSVEAEASNVYWQGIALVLKDNIDFPGRKKKFDLPKDPINICLNYGYGILASEIWLAVEYASLDPFAGFLHADSPRRPALVVDLIEEFRQPVVDRSILSIAMDSPKRMQSFLDGGKLSQEGRKAVIELVYNRLNEQITFQNRRLPIYTHILLQARRIGDFLLKRVSTYDPFITKW
ncbi:MAG: CRISPR-associated endonuclease Cas1 [Nitrososphaerales archaeon]